MAATLSTRFTGIEFENPFLLASAPPTESDANILRAFEAGWGGVVVKTIGMHPVINVKGPKTKFMRSSIDSYRVSMDKRANTALHSSWNWELISDKPLDWWLPRLRRIKDAFPSKVLVASIMAGSEDENELNHWRELAMACQEQGVDAFELNLSCPHMDRVDMGSNIGKNVQLIDMVVRAVKEVAKRPVWVKLTPTTTNIAKEAEAAFNAGADAISSSNTFTSLPPIDPESLEFEVNVDGLVSYGGLGGPAILPLSMAKMAQMTTAFPNKSFSGIGGISDFSQALNYFLLGCGTAQVCTAAMLDHAIGPNVIKGLLSGMQAFLEKHADRGWRSLDDIRGLRRDRIVAHHQIKRPDAKEYHGGREAHEGYAAPATSNP
jgi:dihydropyrimidine dehydrogenase (NAD+) subunit PreA